MCTVLSLEFKTAVAHGDLDLSLIQPPKSWDYRCVPLYLA